MEDFKQHLYYCLSEECAEAIQRVSKLLRFGEGEWSPYDLTCTTNIEKLRNELIDVLAVMEMLNMSINTFEPEVRSKINAKQLKVQDFYVKAGGTFNGKI